MNPRLLSRARLLRTLAALTLLVAAVTAAPAVTAAEATPASASPGQRPGRVLVGLVDEVRGGRSMAAVPGVAHTRRAARTGVTVVDLEPGQSPARVAAQLAGRADVRWAEPDQRVHLAGLADLFADPHAGWLWGLDNVGQTIGSLVGLPGVDIDVEGAWSRTRGSRDVVVAVVDTGVDVSHPDLAANVWRNPGEVAGNGRDDDGNGYVDDVTGWDFHNDDASVFDSADGDAHGTHIAGTIAAVGGNGRGIVGVAPGVRVLPLKFMDADGSGWTSDAVAALDYAARVGVDVVNLSWGGPTGGRALSEAISRVDAVVVAAAGNEGTDLDVTPVYPAAYGHDTLVSVAAVDNRGRVPGFSNHGDRTVDLGAPGVGIVSTVPGGYASMHGTSMAAPHVAGVAALASAAAPSASPAAIAQALVATTRSLSSLAGTTRSGGLVDADATLSHLLASDAPTPDAPVATDPTPTTDATTAPAPETSPEPEPDPTPELEPEPDPEPAPTPEPEPAPEAEPTPDPTPAPEPVRTPSVSRLAGTDRYATAAAITKAAFPEPVHEVVVATGVSFADALSGAAAAAERGAPVLLVPPTGLPTAVRDELVRLSPARVTVLGGRAAVPETVVRQLAAATGARVERLAGADRYVTSAATSAHAFDRGVPVVYLATGTSFPDALAAGAAAGRLGGPVLLTDPQALPDAVRAELRRLDPDRVVVLGGAAAVSEEVRRAAGRAAGAPTERLGGRSRYETAATVVRDAFPRDVQTVLLATGESFPDALGGGAAAAVLGAAVLLVPPTGPLPDATARELTRLSPDRVLVLGGTGALSRETLDRVTARVG